MKMLPHSSMKTVYQLCQPTNAICRYPSSVIPYPSSIVLLQPIYVAVCLPSWAISIQSSLLHPIMYQLVSGYSKSVCPAALMGWSMPPCHSKPCSKTNQKNHG